MLLPLGVDTTWFETQFQTLSQEIAQMDKRISDRLATLDQTLKDERAQFLAGLTALRGVISADNDAAVAELDKLISLAQGVVTPEDNPGSPTVTPNPIA
jgi:hypothetical protein